MYTVPPALAGMKAWARAGQLPQTLSGLATC